MIIISNHRDSELYLSAYSSERKLFRFEYGENSEFSDLLSLQAEMKQVVNHYQKTTGDPLVICFEAYKIEDRFLNIVYTNINGEELLIEKEAPMIIFPLKEFSKSCLKYYPFESMTELGVVGSVVDEEEVDVYRVAVRALIEEDGKFLFMATDEKRPGYQKYQGLDSIGGGVYPTETLKTALIREVQEESGLELKNIKLLGFISEYVTLTNKQELIGKINRKSYQIYFTGEVCGYSTTNLCDYEKLNFVGIERFGLKDAIEVFRVKVENNTQNMMNTFFKRELVMLEHLEKKQVRSKNECS